jgi:hypothetical protein
MTDFSCRKKRKELYTCIIKCMSKLAYICICGYVSAYRYVVILSACAYVYMQACMCVCTPHTYRDTQRPSAAGRIR